MRILGTALRRGLSGAFAACALIGAAAGTVALPTASAADDCSASGLASAGSYLAAHPDANQVLTAAGSQPRDEAKSNVQAYFLSHPGEFLDLKGIAQPLTDLRNQCGVAVTPGQLAALVESFQP
jgi:hemophore-related protein